MADIVVCYNDETLERFPRDTYIAFVRPGSVVFDIMKKEDRTVHRWFGIRHEVEFVPFKVIPLTRIRWIEWQQEE
jgi:hypothetical protein